MYYFSNKKNFKSYWFDIVEKEFISYFPKLISYTRFIEIKKKYKILFEVILNYFIPKKYYGNSFIDSFCIKSCHIKREHMTKILQNISGKTKSTMGWVFGRKLFLAIDEHMNILFYIYHQANIAYNNAKNIIQVNQKIR